MNSTNPIEITIRSILGFPDALRLFLVSVKKTGYAKSQSTLEANELHVYPAPDGSIPKIDSQDSVGHPIKTVLHTVPTNSTTIFPFQAKSRLRHTLPA